ncbi:MAG: hypothetical protein ACXWTY_08375 [Methylobacter sp.]
MPGYPETVANSCLSERVGVRDGLDKIFQLRVKLHGQAARETTVTIDTPVHEKNITYPPAGKVAMKIINRPTKLAQQFSIQAGRFGTR